MTSSFWSWVSYILCSDLSSRVHVMSSASEKVIKHNQKESKGWLCLVIWCIPIKENQEIGGLWHSIIDLWRDEVTGMDKTLISPIWDNSQLNPVELHPYKISKTERSTKPFFLVPGSPVPLCHCGCTSGVTRPLAVLNFPFSCTSESRFGHLDLLELQRK